jgi:hypothetical protein
VCSCPWLTRRGETGDKGRGREASTSQPPSQRRTYQNVSTVALLRHDVNVSQGHCENDTPASCSVALMAASISSFRAAFLAAMVLRMMILFLGSE